MNFLILVNGNSAIRIQNQIPSDKYSLVVVVFKRSQTIDQFLHCERQPKKEINVFCPSHRLIFRNYQA